MSNPDFRRPQRQVLSLGMVACLVLAGCGKTAQAPPPLPIEQVPQTLENAFESAPSEVSQAASEAVTAVRADDPGALTDLQELTARSDLTREQHLAAARAMAAYLQKLRDTADKGDKKAEEALQHYRSTK